MNLNPEHQFINNNIITAIHALFQKVDYLTVIVEAFAECSGDEVYKNVEKKVCERRYINLLEMKKNNRSPDLQVSRSIQKEVDGYREQMVKRFGDIFVADVEKKYNVDSKEDPSWMIKNMPMV